MLDPESEPTGSSPEGEPLESDADQESGARDADSDDTGEQEKSTKENQSERSRSWFSKWRAQRNLAKKGLMESGLTEEQVERTKKQAEAEDFLSEQEKQFRAEIEAAIGGTEHKDILLEGRGWESSDNLVLLHRLREKEPETYLQMIEQMKGRVLLDLGCGRDPVLEIVFAQAVGASKYIGVDKFHQPRASGEFVDEKVKFILNSDSGREELRIRPGDFENDRPEIELKRDDMLRVLSRMPSNSANIMMNNLDIIIWGGLGGLTESQAKANERYDQLLVREMIRVAGPDGLIIMNNSFYIPQLKGKDVGCMHAIYGLKDKEDKYKS